MNGWECHSTLSANEDPSILLVLTLSSKKCVSDVRFSTFSLLSLIQSTLHLCTMYSDVIVVLLYHIISTVQYHIYTM